MKDLIDWEKVNFTSEEDEIIEKIVERAHKLTGRERIQIRMDIVATHTFSDQLRLKDLLEADDFDFLHDIRGIEKHLNRRTGKLDRYFLPRFAK